VVTERAARPAKSERPQRTEAERAARREKREKRDKREGRAERPAPVDRTERPAEGTVTSAVIVPSEVPLVESPLPDEVIGRIPGGVDGEAVSPVGAAPGRKRKRRRRRGERKDRPGSVAGGMSLDADEAGDGGPDDGALDDDSRSPYSSQVPSAPERTEAGSIEPRSAPQAPQPSAPVIPSFTEPIE
jgi:hypothetical protein